DDIVIPKKVFILEETVETVQESEEVAACKPVKEWLVLLAKLTPGCQCPCAELEKRSTGTITTELEAQLVCAHAHLCMTKPCPFSPQIMEELTDSKSENEMSQDQVSLFEPERSSSESQSSQCEPGVSIEECVQDAKSIIFDSKLKELFNVCHEPGCGASVISSSQYRSGFAITMESECVVGYKRKWESLQTTPTPHLWKLVTSSAWCPSRGNSSPTYSASTSFGTYTILDSASHLILAQESVHVTELKNIYWLETEGLERCLQHTEAHGCVVETLATDRHPSVRVLLRDSYSHIWHEYDLWHIQ
ncbi:unnamed protein product, partial [Coregonus sp. 'balchen']